MVKEIELTQGKVALVDDADYEWVNQWKWTATKTPHGFYATRNKGRWKVQKTILLHRVIMNAPKGIHVDHKNGDGLDCTRKNMRFATPAQNAMNRGMSRNNTSGYKGVTWDAHAGKWKAQIQVDKKLLYLGIFHDKEEAAKAYDKAAKKHHGDFARINFHG